MDIYKHRNAVEAAARRIDQLREPERLVAEFQDRTIYDTLETISLLLVGVLHGMERDNG
ncbi:hypothetical protein [Alsobacter metallidurans]|uniref:hypothetical protein n=1 Tax=Alsobacter metallidurans TaxID=340221 RepID=UPI00166393C5|nr:hypothetical protein [Alsobacter metallidurans]